MAVPATPVVQSMEREEQPLTLALWAAGVLDRWRTIIVTVVAALVVAIIAAVALPPAYRVTVSFAPNPTSSSKLSGAMSALGGLSGLTGDIGGMLGSATEPTESPAFYAELLQSRELLTRLLLTRFADPRTANPRDSARLVNIMHLRSNNAARRIELGVKMLRKSMRTETDTRTDLVKITVSERYPELAAREANVVLDLVNAFNLEQRVSRARAKRVYLAERLDAAKSDLAVAKARYRNFLDSNRQWQTSPALSSDEATFRRDRDMATDAYVALDKQFEAARLDEFNDAALITVVDSAVAPQRAEWPRYSMLIPGAVIAGVLLGVMIAGVATVYGDWKLREPLAAHRLSSALRRGRHRTDAASVARRA